ncbi:DUF4399 domain-containing protein [Waterburya agarophytonicola K14]|uniref:DUF4399 domain-containing protein n=1 Tax=Waterburya agarophytonicola KI4 TaxID=2874699 RepID=A0A964FGN8_9CYAN|nr:DUF4399 domain-containing protein [Waterburya agarophytonicola]MCC0176698.1 DUF4399 domain-containing protein [Waterburya agarophytonicola KI4]
MKFKALVTGVICAFLFLIAPPVLAQDLVSHAPSNARAYIIEPADGKTLPETFTVKFGLSGMDLAPAGVDQDNTGHHHLLIDRPEFDPTTSLPATEQIRHFGKAQTETELTLTPGEHTLQLVLGNYAHVPHDNPVMSETITVTVE